MTSVCFLRHNSFTYLYAPIFFSKSLLKSENVFVCKDQRNKIKISLFIDNEMTREKEVRKV